MCCCRGCRRSDNAGRCGPGPTAIEKTGGYLYSRALLALINGGLMFLTLRLLGVPYALALGLFVGVVAAFIPIVGTYIAGAVPVLVALAAVGPAAAVIVLVEVLATSSWRTMS